MLRHCPLVVGLGQRVCHSQYLIHFSQQEWVGSLGNLWNQPLQFTPPSKLEKGGRPSAISDSVEYATIIEFILNCSLGKLFYRDLYRFNRWIINKPLFSEWNYLNIVRMARKPLIRRTLWGGNPFDKQSNPFFCDYFLFNLFSRSVFDFDNLRLALGTAWARECLEQPLAITKLSSAGTIFRRFSPF